MKLSFPQIAGLSGNLPKSVQRMKELDGRECECIGVADCNGYRYAAIKLPEHGKYEYEIVDQENLRA